MSTGKVKKIHRAALLGSRRGTYNCSAYYQQRRGWCFLPVLPGGGPAAAPVPSYPAARTRTIVPSKYPGSAFTSDSPRRIRLPATQPRTIVRVITQIRCGPGNYWHTKYCCWLRCWYLGYPEQFVGLSPGTSAALIPNPEYS